MSPMPPLSLLLLLAAAASSVAAPACDISAPFDAKPDNKTDNTAAIQAALSDPSCAIVLIPVGGTFLARSLYVGNMSHRALLLPPGAELGIWPDPATYGSNSAFLNAPQPLQNFSLGGGGTIRGFGPVWWAHCARDPMYCFRPNTVAIENVASLLPILLSLIPRIGILTSAGPTFSWSKSGPLPTSANARVMAARQTQTAATSAASTSLYVTWLCITVTTVSPLQAKVRQGKRQVMSASQTSSAPAAPTAVWCTIRTAL